MEWKNSYPSHDDLGIKVISDYPKFISKEDLSKKEMDHIGERLLNTSNNDDG